MKIFKVTRTDRGLEQYDIYDSFVVVCEDEDRARDIVPTFNDKIETFADVKNDACRSYTWIRSRQKDTLVVECIGTAKGPERYILCSFHAG